MMIQTINVVLLNGMYTGNSWSGVIEIASDDSLEELHLAIQDAVEFDNDHMYEFFIAKTMRSRDAIRYECNSGRIFRTTVQLAFEVAKGKKLFYNFDYGDNWLFQINKSRKNPTLPSANVTYPRLVEEVGDKPIQYPDWEE